MLIPKSGLVTGKQTAMGWTGSHYVGQAGHKLTAVLPRFPKYEDGDTVALQSCDLYVSDL